MKDKSKMKQEKIGKFDIHPLYERDEEINEMNREKDIENEVPVNKLRILEQKIEELEAMINKKMERYIGENSEARRLK